MKGKEPDIASASIPDTLAAFRVNPDSGLTQAQVAAQRKAHGYNEVTKQKAHPILKFLGKSLRPGMCSLFPRTSGHHRLA